MSRVPLIVANWKMHKSSSEVVSFIHTLKQEWQVCDKRVFLAPSFLSLEAAIKACEGSSIQIGAQNIHPSLEGAFTGEVSARMLQESKVFFVILGHSERRHYFGETNSLIHKKVEQALAHNLMPIVCIGESLIERENDTHHDVLKTQIEQCLQGLEKSQAAKIAVAYEPIWAIGTGKTATPEMAQETHSQIRCFLEKLFGRECAHKIPLLYGGSVKPDNIASLMEQTDIDGVLVGGASLEVRSFINIINY